MKAHPLAGIIAGAARLISGVNVRWVDSEPEARQAVLVERHDPVLAHLVDVDVGRDVVRAAGVATALSYSRIMGANNRLQNGNATGQVITMKSYQDAAKHTTPEIDGHGDRCDQNRNSRGLLELGGDSKNVVECGGGEQASGDDRQADP